MTSDKSQPSGLCPTCGGKLDEFACEREDCYVREQKRALDRTRKRMFDRIGDKSQPREADVPSAGSETPETDAIEHPFRQRNDQTYTTMLEHARSLERRLAQAVAERDGYMKQAEEYYRESWKQRERAARASSPGCVVVPRVPTVTMIQAAAKAYRVTKAHAGSIERRIAEAYQAMLSAAPAAGTGEEP